MRQTNHGISQRSYQPPYECCTFVNAGTWMSNYWSEVDNFLELQKMVVSCCPYQRTGERRVRIQP